MKIFCIDIDGVIITNEGHDTNPNISNGKVIEKNVKLINKLYDAGNYIKLYTSRGQWTKLDWAQKTYSELRNANLKYHEIVFNKPYADYYIDDKHITIEKAEELLNECGIDTTKEG